MATKGEELQGKVEQLSTDIGLVNVFTHGTESQTVTLGGKKTPTIRKMVADIDARESSRAQAVINTATAQITTEGTRQVGLVNTAGNTQYKRVNDEGTAQYNKVKTEGDSQCSKINTTGNTQVIRVTKEGNAQYKRVNDEGVAQYSRIKVEGNTQCLRVRDVGDVQVDYLKTVAADKIERTEQAADRAENAARSIPGFAANLRNFFGLRVDERMHLTVVKSEDGDRLRGADYDHWYVLPHESRFFIDNGRLMLELPFQAQP